MGQINPSDTRKRKPDVDSGDQHVLEQTSSTSDMPPSNVTPRRPSKHGIGVQALRIVGFGLSFFTAGIIIHFGQLLGVPLYFISKDWYYAWMAMSKQFFGALLTAMTKWWSPTRVRVSGDKSMKGLLRQVGEKGMLEVDFGERVVLMANHQIYTDWLYLWWVAYSNSTPTHGYFYIILKDSLKWIPLIGPGMQFFSFVFMARKWASDQERMRYRLRKLNSRTSGPLSDKDEGKQLDPMWLLIFPEGTNLSRNTRKSSVKFSEKSGIPDMMHQLLPRSTGLEFCLQELRRTVPYLYDCTIAYEGVPDGQYAQDIFTLRSVYFQGRPPRSVNMHWRRFAVADLPLDDHGRMSEWVLARWREKDELLEAFQRTGRFPADVDAVHIEDGPGDEFKTAYINTEVMPRIAIEVLYMFGPILAAALVGRIGVQIFDRLFGREAIF